jgi:thymidine kinase
MTIFGNGGSGKTVGCIKVIRDYVGGEKEDVWIIAPGNEQLANLKDLNSTLYTIDEAKDKLIKSLDTEEVEVEGNYVVPKVNNVSLNIDKSKLPKCIIIDESTHLDSTTLQALNKIASDNNISVIAVGDDLQNGYENEESGKDNESLHISNVGNSAVVFCGRSSRLGITLRDTNFQKSENNNILANITSNLLHIPVNVSKIDRDARIKNAIKAFEDFTLQYYYGEIINGDYITPTLDD